MSERPWYEEWFSSPYYHRLYFEKDETEEAAFIGRLISHLAPLPDSLILDVACGRGRHSRILAAAGFPVTGIDLSFSNIDYAIKKNRITDEEEEQNPEYFQHDLRLPFRINFFNYAFNFLTGFGYFKTRREDEDAIRTVCNALKKQGIFVLDYLNVHFAESGLVYNEERTVDGTIYEIHRWQDETHFYKRIRITDALLTSPVEFTEKVAKYSLGDFTEMLAYRGLQVQDVFGDYQLGHYDVKQKPRMIIVAKK